ncbi:MAG: TIGR00266 family protein [Sulfolobaceae archaeon]|nr:TIGR00266 family protein [Sulfolobaceae archaeon]
MPEYQIVGNDFQYLIANLQEGEKIYAEGGHLIYKDSSVKLNARLKGGLLRAIARELTGGTFFLLEVEGPGSVAFSSFFPGKVVRIDLNGEKILAEHTSFLMCESSVEYSATLSRLSAGLFGGEGIFLAEFYGNGAVFLHGEGDVQEIDLQEGQAVEIEASHLLAMDSSVNYTVTRVGGLKTMLFGDEGLFFVKAIGPGRIWIRSASRFQFVASILKNLPRSS